MPDRRQLPPFQSEWSPSRRMTLDLSPASGGWSWMLASGYAGSATYNDSGTPAYVFATTTGAGNGVVGVCPIEIPYLPDGPNYAAAQQRYNVRGATATTLTTPAAFRFLSLSAKLYKGNAADTATLALMRRPRDGSGAAAAVDTLTAGATIGSFVEDTYTTAFNLDLANYFYYLKAILEADTTAARISDVQMVVAALFPR